VPGKDRGVFGIPDALRSLERRLAFAGVLDDPIMTAVDSPQPDGLGDGNLTARTFVGAIVALFDAVCAAESRDRP